MVLDCQLQHPHVDFTDAAMSQAVTFSLLNVSPTQALMETSSPYPWSCSAFSEHTLIHSAPPDPPVLLQLREVTMSFPGQLSVGICQLVRSRFSDVFSQRRIIYWESYVRGKCNHLSELKRTIFCALPGSVFLKRDLMMVHCTQKEGGCSTQKEKHFYT